LRERAKFVLNYRRAAQFSAPKPSLTPMKDQAATLNWSARSNKSLMVIDLRSDECDHLSS